MIFSTKQIIAGALALSIGVLYGVSLAPFQIWYDAQDPATSNALVRNSKKFNCTFPFLIIVFLDVCYFSLFWYFLNE